VRSLRPDYSPKRIAANRHGVNLRSLAAAAAWLRQAAEISSIMVWPFKIRKQYHVAVFLPDGSLEGLAKRDVSDLSPKWLQTFSDFLRANGEVFRASLGGPLGNIDIKLTSTSGAGLGMFFVNGQLGVSTAYFSGANPASEAEIQTMFVASLRKSQPAGSKAFGALLSITQRPLYVAVVWANPAISEDDHDLLSEMSDHLAAAFLFGSTAGGAA
jgi:hypothetical protein